MIGESRLHYKILEKIGEGGMGVVYKAEDTKLERTVAIKFLPRHIAANEGERERFKIEAKAAAALNHPNIATIHAIEESDDEMFIVMEFIEGQELRDIIGVQNFEPLPLEKTIDYATQIAGGLNAAHAKGIVHRDIKSSNILVTESGQVKIMDFGLAKIGGGTQLTKDHSTLGTAAYMSPEQARGEPVDHRTDIWSFGVLLYEMLSGQLPFRGDYEQAILYAILNEEPQPLAELQPSAQRKIQHVVKKALSKNLDERYQDAGELLADLRAEGNENISESPGGKSPEKSFINKRWPIFAGVIALAALLMMLVRYGFNSSNSTTVAIEKSIAVLPLADLSSAKDQDYFCDGMTEQIITNLSHLENLKVIARTSVMKFRDTEKTIPEIGKELNVSYVLEGSIRKSGDRIRVTAQLVKSNDGYQLWAQNFDKELKDVFAVQDEVSEAIATALFKELTSKEVSSLKSPRSVNVEAYEYYLKGRYFHDQKFWGSYRQEDFQEAKSMFEKAIELDPNYALAYAGLADLYDTYLMNVNSKQKIYNLRESLIKKAYALNPNLPYVLEVYSFVLEAQGKYEEAYKALEKALQISPNESEYNFIMGIFLRNQGLIHQAIRYYTTALQQNPLYNMIYIYRGNANMVIGNFEAAETDFKKALQIEPHHVEGLNSLAQLSIMKQDYDSAEAYLAQGEMLNPNYQDYHRTKTWLFAAKGEKEKALSTYEDDITYLLLGLNDQAYQKLEQLLEKDWRDVSPTEKHTDYLSLVNLPVYDSIRNDARFKEILKKEKIKYEGKLQKYGGGINGL